MTKAPESGNNVEQAARDKVIAELSYNEEELARKPSDTGSNLSMTDESKPTSDTKPAP